ncbi:MAG: hypothetical protein M1415_09430 [Firmicutes bacterium]|nr:hypothetical protein [Bacillota bacterium]MCL5063829.1 hypothetical protein [Bacillota bacterium]
MSNPSCASMQDELPWLVNGSLARHQQRPLWQHIAGCGDCRSALVEWTRLATTVQAGSIEAPPMVLAEVWQAVHLATTQAEEMKSEASLLLALFSPVIMASRTVREAIWCVLLATAAS